MHRTRRRSAVVAALLLVATGHVRAADDDRIVPAHHEPRHVPKFENTRVRVIDVAIPQDEQTLFHAHSLDYPYLMISSVTLKNQIPGGEPKDVKIERGVVGYYRATTQGTYTHRFINRGPGVFRAIGIELMQPMAFGARVAAPVPDAIGTRTVLDTERVRAVRIRLEPGASVAGITFGGPGVRVAMDAGCVRVEAGGVVPREIAVQPASFEYVEPESALTLRNCGNTVVELVHFELK